MPSKKKVKKGKRSAVRVEDEQTKTKQLKPLEAEEGEHYEGSDWNSEDERLRAEQSEVENDESPAKFINEDEMQEDELEKPGDWLIEFYNTNPVKQFLAKLWTNLEVDPSSKGICEQMNARISELNREHGANPSTGQFPFNSFAGQKQLAAVELQKIRANTASKKDILKAWDKYSKIRNTWAAQLQRLGLPSQFNFPDGFAEQFTGKSVRNAKDHSKTQDPQQKSRSSKHKRIKPLQKVIEVSESESSDSNSEDSDESSDDDSIVDSSDEEDYDTDQFDPDVDDSAENLQHMVGLVYDMPPSKVLAYRRMGKIGYQVLVQQEINGACRYRLVPASSVGGIDPAATINLATSHRGKKTNEDGDWVYRKADVKRIKAVAWKVSESEAGVEELKPGPVGTYYSATDVLIEWTDGISTWEPRGNLRRMYGKEEDIYKADALIHYRAKCQELKYQRALDEAKKTRSRSKSSSKTKHRSHSKFNSEASTRSQQPISLSSRKSTSANSVSNRSERPSHVSFTTNNPDKRVRLEESFKGKGKGKEKEKEKENRIIKKGKKKQSKQLLSPPSSRYED
ncbi:hypothetical protein MMC30_007329 [Trapelia coarctata]|nr:hypothetical protein [Trapelia coarctata]